MKIFQVVIISLVFSAYSCFVMLSAKSAHAECFRQDKSAGGAQLFVISSSSRVRVERTSNGYDIGMKMSDIGEDFVRTVVPFGEAFEIVGQRIDVDENNKSIVQDIARVILAADQLIVIGNGQVMLQDLRTSDNKSLNCSRDRGEITQWLKSEIAGLGIKLSSRTVKVASGNAVLAAIGL